MKYLWIGAIVLIFGLRLFIRSMRHNEQQEYQHLVEEQEEYQKHAGERFKRFSEATSGEKATSKDESRSFYKGLVERNYLQYADPADTRLSSIQTVKMCFPWLMQKTIRFCPTDAIIPATEVSYIWKAAL